MVLRILVSVEHGHERVTVSVPDDMPVESLLPRLLDVCGADDSALWALAPRSNGYLDGRRTLREAGVWPGSILALRLVGPGDRRRPRGERGSGWRAAADATRQQARVTPPVGRGAVIAVASLHPSCGKTTVAALLAALLARALPTAPLVIDGDLGDRGLSRWLAPRLHLGAETYAGLVSGELLLGDLPRAASGALLLAAPDEVAAPAPDAAACAEMLGRLRMDRNVVLLDCSAGFGTPWGQAAWAAAEHLVLVCDDRRDDLSGEAQVAATLAGPGVGVTVVANHSRARPRLRKAARKMGLREMLVGLPEDGLSAADLRAGRLTWEGTPPAWRRAAAWLGATLSARWA